MTHASHVSQGMQRQMHVGHMASHVCDTCMHANREVYKRGGKSVRRGVEEKQRKEGKKEEEKTKRERGRKEIDVSKIRIRRTKK